MPDAVSYTREGDVAVIAVDNPPVNALSIGVRTGIWDAMDRFAADDEAKAAIIYGVGRTFIAGADIKEFGLTPQKPFLPDLCNRIEDQEKPVIAAIHGTALGGGLEICLGCHYRVALASARVGLPEVHLGLLPGAGGTQRTPRLVGAEAALEMITSGRHVSAKEAAAKGLIDEVAAGDDPKKAGVAFAKKVIADGAKVRRTRDRDVEGASDELFAKWRADMVKKSRGQKSPVWIVDSIAASVLPFDEGSERERALFQELHDDPQRAALVHAFFGERAVGKIPEGKSEPRPLKLIGVIGGGTMGAGITAAALNAGLDTVMVEMNPEALSRGVSNLERNYASAIQKGRMSESDLENLLGEKFTGSCDLDALEDCDLVIEAVFEKMDVKKDIFGKLDKIVKKGAVLASNTSYLNIDKIAAVTSRPQDVLGLHFFSPAHVMKLLEVVVGTKTAPEVVATGFALARKMKKIAVRAGVCDGFIGNRILGAYLKVANMMVEDGADPYVIDETVREFGYPMGPFQMGDLAGLDIGYLNRRGQDDARDSKDRYAAGFLDKMYEKKWLGQKTGIGFYDYKGGARSGPPNPGVMPMIEDERRRLKINARPFGKDEIMRRYMAAMVNEAAKVVGEGIALRPVDVDMTALFGYGFPRTKGGPLHWADEFGLDRILADIREFAKEDPQFWEPAPLLVELVEKNGKFGDLNNA